MRKKTVAGICLAVLTTCAGCAGSAAPASNGKVPVVAAESFWASLVRQIGGTHVDVSAVISNPATDPHDYEPTAADGRRIATAGYVIVNGAGYDGWASQLLSAGGRRSRRVLDVAQLVGAKLGDNPHLWYVPGDVDRVVVRIAADLAQLDPPHASYYRAQLALLERKGFARYKALLSEIRSKYAGVPIGATESIVTGLAQATGLDLLTPPAFLNAISEGDDPTAADKRTVDLQIASAAIKVLVFNSQNATPDVRRVVDAARNRRIAVVAITETPPRNTEFQDWQASELQALLDALAGAIGR